nr:MAG TPA: hypothetical protein [Caudoviricetes sp.]
MIALLLKLRIGKPRDNINKRGMVALRRHLLYTY